MSHDPFAEQDRRVWFDGEGPLDDERDPEAREWSPCDDDGHDYDILDGRCRVCFEHAPPSQPRPKGAR